MNVRAAGFSMSTGISASMLGAIGAIALVGGAVFKMAGEVASAFQMSISEAIKFEQAFAHVRKVLDEGTDAKGLRNSLIDLSNTIPVAATELAKFAMIGAQMGIAGKENLTKFADLVARLGETAEMSGEQAATMLARIAQVNKIPVEDYNKLASAIVGIAKEHNATAGEVMRATMQMQGLGAQAGLTAQQMIGLSTVLISSGLRIESLGTASGRMARDINNAVALGGEKLQTLAKLSGMTAEEFQFNWREDRAGTLVKVFEGIALAGDKSAAVLEKLGWQNVRVSSAANAAAISVDKVRESIAATNDFFEKGTEIFTQSNTVFETTAGQLKQVGEIIKNIGIEFGTAFLPALLDGLKEIQPLLRELFNIVRELAPAFMALGKAIVSGFVTDLKLMTHPLDTIKEALKKDANTIGGWIKGFAFGGRQDGAAGAGGAFGGGPPLAPEAATSAGIPQVRMLDPDLLINTKIEKKKAKIRQHMDALVEKAFEAFLDETDPGQKSYLSGSIGLRMPKEGVFGPMTKSDLGPNGLMPGTPPLTGAALDENNAAYNKIYAEQLDKFNKQHQVIRSLKTATIDWGRELENVANIVSSMGGAFSKVLGSIIGGVGGIGSAIQGIKKNQILYDESGKVAGKTSFLKGGFGKILGDVAGGLQIAGAAIGIGKAIVGLFKSDPVKVAQKEVAKALGHGISREFAEEVMKRAKEMGVSLSVAAKTMEAETKFAQMKTNEDKFRGGLDIAKGGAESLSGLLGTDSVLSGAVKAASQPLIDAVQSALIANGQGMMLNGPLAESKEFKAAMDAAQATAQIVKGMIQAGGIDQAFMGNTGKMASAVRDDAEKAALKAGLSPAEAEKAGIASIAPILREQLNASLASGKDLDENTKALLQEAKDNGIDIVADVEYQQLAELRGIRSALGGGTGTGSNTTPRNPHGRDEPPDFSAAKGFGTFRPVTLDEDTKFQAHKGEGVLIVPKDKMGVGKFVFARRGYFDDDPDQPGTGGQGGGGQGGGSQAPPETPPNFEQMVEKAVSKAVEKVARPITIAPNIKIDEDPNQTAQARDERRKMSVDAIVTAFRDRVPSLMIEARRALAE